MALAQTACCEHDLQGFQFRLQFHGFDVTCMSWSVLRGIWGFGISYHYGVEAAVPDGPCMSRSCWNPAAVQRAFPSHPSSVMPFFRVLPLAAALLLAACGTTDTTRYPIPADAAPELIAPWPNFEDARAAEFRRSGEQDASGSTMTYIADDKMSPTPPQLLAMTLRINGTPETAKVVLEEFIVTVYEPALGPGNAGIGVAFGLIGALMDMGVQRAILRKTVNVRIKGSIDCQPFLAMALDSFKGAVEEKHINGVIKQALDSIGRQAESTEAIVEAKTTDDSF